MGYEASIEQFKGVLKGGGVRPTMFQVSVNFPRDVVSDGLSADGDNKVTFLCKAAQLPPSQVTPIEIPFRGRKLKVAGDRSFENWSVTIINDDSFLIRKAMEKWSEKIQNHNYALGATRLSTYFSDAFVRQLDRDASLLRTYAFRGVWPINVGDIPLSFEADGVEEYTVDFAVQYWSAAKEDPGQPSGSPEDITKGTGRIVS